MGIKVSCPDCFQTYQFKSELAGKKTRCRACGAVIKIEQVELDELDDFEEDDYEPPVRRPSRSKRKSRAKSGHFWQSVLSDANLNQFSDFALRSSVGPLVIGCPIAFLLAYLCSRGMFGAISMYVLVGLLFLNLILIMMSFKDAFSIAIREHTWPILLIFVPGPGWLLLVLYLMTSRHCSEARGQMRVTTGWMFSMLFAMISVVNSGTAMDAHGLPIRIGNPRPPINVNPPPQANADFPPPAAPQLPPSVNPRDNPNQDFVAAADAAQRQFQEQQQKAAATAPATPSGPSRMIFSTNLINYRGTKEPTSAAREALQSLAWIDIDHVVVNPVEKKIIMPCRGGSVQGQEAQRLLEQAGFEVRGQSIQSVR